MKTNTDQSHLMQDLLTGILQLPDPPSQSAAVSMLAAVRRAEAAAQIAEIQLEGALNNLAHSLCDPEDGWSFDEIWQTNLRGTPIVKKLREAGKNLEPEMPTKLLLRNTLTEEYFNGKNFAGGVETAVEVDPHCSQMLWENVQKVHPRPDFNLKA